MIHDSARAYVGTPFRHLGRCPGLGLDCVGVVLCAAWANGLKVPDTRDYGRVPLPHKVISMAEERADPVKLVDAEPGDVLCMQWRREMPMHFAIFGDGWVVQALENVGRVVVTQLSRSVRSRIHSVWRLRPWRP